MNLKDTTARIERLRKLSENLANERIRWRSNYEHFVSEYLSGFRAFQNGIDDAKLALVKAKRRLERTPGGVGHLPADRLIFSIPA